MPVGPLESILSQLYYATRTLSPVRLVLKVTLFLLLHCTGVFLRFWGVLTRLDRVPSNRRLQRGCFLAKLTPENPGNNANYPDVGIRK